VKLHSLRVLHCTVPLPQYRLSTVASHWIAPLCFKQWLTPSRVPLCRFNNSGAALSKVSQPTNLSISTTWFLLNLVTTHVLHLWSLLLVNLPAPLWKSQIAPLGMLHLVYGMNSPLISASLVRHSLLLFLLSHMTVHRLHNLHYHRFYASSLTRSVFHSELKTWLFSKSFPPYTFSFLFYRTDATDSRII